MEPMLRCRVCGKLFRAPPNKTKGPRARATNYCSLACAASLSDRPYLYDPEWYKKRYDIGMGYVQMADEIGVTPNCIRHRAMYSGAYLPKKKQKIIRRKIQLRAPPELMRRLGLPEDEK